LDKIEGAKMKNLSSIMAIVFSVILTNTYIAVAFNYYPGAVPRSWNSTQPDRNIAFCINSNCDELTQSEIYQGIDDAIVLWNANNAGTYVQFS
jgi:hypothetical protein